MTAKQLERETGCKIMVRGRGSMRDHRKVCKFPSSFILRVYLLSLIEFELTVFDLAVKSWARKMTEEDLSDIYSC